MGNLVFSKYNVKFTQYDKTFLNLCGESIIYSKTTNIMIFIGMDIKKQIVKIFMIDADINGQFMRFYGKFDISQVLSKFCII